MDWIVTKRWHNNQRTKLALTQNKLPWLFCNNNITPYNQFFLSSKQHGEKKEECQSFGVFNETHFRLKKL